MVTMANRKTTQWIYSITYVGKIEEHFLLRSIYIVRPKLNKRFYKKIECQRILLQKLLKDYRNFNENYERL